METTDLVEETYCTFIYCPLSPLQAKGAQVLEEPDDPQEGSGV